MSPTCHSNSPLPILLISVFYNVVKFQSPNYNTFWDVHYCPVWFLVKSNRQLEKLFLECSQYFSRMHLVVFYNMVKFQRPNCNTFWYMNYYPVWILVKSNRQLEKLFLECSQYFSRMRLVVFYNVVEFQRPNCNTFWDMNYYPVWILVKSGQTDGRTDRRTESDAYEPTVQSAQVGSKSLLKLK